MRKISQLIGSDNAGLAADELAVKLAFLEFAEWAGNNTKLLAIGAGYGFEMGLSADARQALRLADDGTDRQRNAADNMGRFSWSDQNK